MIKKLDIYIIKKFLGTFFFMIGAFMLIAVVFDISENIDELLKSEAPWYSIITDYYFNFCFYFGTLLSSFIIFLTIIWFTSKLAQQSEIIAILCGGVSYARIIRPYFIAAGILVSLMLLLSHIIVPRANRVKYEFEVQYLKGALTVAEQNMHREISPGVIAYFSSFRPESNSGSDFSLEKWNNGKLTYKLISSGATIHPETQIWTIEKVQIRTFHDDGTESLILKDKLDTLLNISDRVFALRAEVAGAMTWTELNQFIDDQKLGGSGRVAQFELEKYNRTASPFSIFVLTLIGVSIASRKQRGGIGLHLLFAVIIGFTFVFINRITQVSAMSLGLSAALAVWIPNILFSLVGLWLYSRAQK
ncbi:MAG: LptF/LptG family permease [Flavobacteriales bacterium]